ncbi:MAG: MoxR family ATPase [Dehalococcoidales bacterium]|nr:MoxR family ATPase [Dehalococcoidales bacterium]
MPVVTTDRRSISQVLFSRKREVDIFPSLHGGQEITYPARRNLKPVGYLSAMLCKACVVALKGDVIGITRLEPPGIVMVRSRSQSAADFHHCYMVENQIWLPRGNVTYHLGLLGIAEALVEKEQASDLLDALEEILDYSQSVLEEDARYRELLMHLSDELYYWSRWRDGDPTRAPERLDRLQVLDAASPPEVTLAGSIDPGVLTDLGKLRDYRKSKETALPAEEPEPQPLKSRFKGPQLAELIESLDLGMHCLLVGPTATGKSLCAFESFERTRVKKPVFVIEGHESLKEFDLLGGYTPDATGGFTWSDGVLVEAMKAGGFLFIDEANRMPTRTLNILLGVLSRGAVVLTEHGSEEVKVQDGFQVVMAMNLGKGYAINTLDTALLNRFSVVLEFRYLPPREEEDLLVAETGVDPAIARTMVKVANETRRLKRNKELSAEITPRGLFAWAAKFKAKRGGNALSRLKAAAKVTWMHQVAGTDADGYLREDTMNTLLDLIEAQTAR